MADEEVEQLIVSLQAARHDNTEWESAAKHASISMLLFGRQVSHLLHCLHDQHFLRHSMTARSTQQERVQRLLLPLHLLLTKLQY